MSLYFSVYEALQSNVKWHVRVLEHYKPVLAVYILSNGEIWTVFPGGRTALNCSGIFPSSPANLLYVSEESAGKLWAWNRIGQTFTGGIINNTGNVIRVAVQENLVFILKYVCHSTYLENHSSC